MVVSMDVTENTIEGGVEPTLDDNDTHIENNDENNEGFTSIASASTEPINTNNSIHSNSIDANEADTTYENYYKSKSIVPDEKPKTELTCELHNGGDLFSNGLKDLINLQLDLIEYQQAKITNKDKQIMVLKNEKEQLEARICRMERRIAIQKRQVEPDENQISKTTRITPKSVGSSSTTTTATATTTSGAKSEFQRYECALPITVNSRHDKDFRYSTYLRTNITYLDLPGSKLLPNVEKQEVKPVKIEEKCEFVSVPSWKVIEKNYTKVKDPPDEDATNDAYVRRHMKPELEEKRRKRWDLQHLRQQQQHQHLAHKDKNKDNKKSSTTHYDDYCSSLFPCLDNVMAIEINNSVPVCIFGYPAPAVSVKELELPWFSIAKREIQLRQAKEKQLKKQTTCRKGYPSAKKKYTKLK